MTRLLDALTAIYLRELRAYFLTPLAYVFIAVCLLALGAFTFEIGRLFDTNRVDLSPFFFFHPWVFLVFLPAVSMRLWAEEARGGTIELLLTVPAPTIALVAGKFLAAWTVAFATLAATTPIWISMNVLGAPDNAAIAVAYLMSLFMAGGYIAIGAAMSAMSGNQVVAFVLSASVGFLITAAGLPVVGSGLAAVFGPGGADMLAALSLLGHFETAQRGVLELRSIVYFAAVIGVFLAINTVWVEARRSSGASRLTHPLAVTGLALILFCGGVLTTHRALSGARLDLTSSRLFTLSQGTRATLARISGPIDLALVFSRAAAADYPALRAHGERVSELMRGVAAQSGGKVRVTLQDPPPYSEAEDRAAAAGLTPAPVEGGDPVYFGVIGRNSVDDEIAIPFLAPERDAMLEYELVRLIAQLDDPSPPKVAVITALPGQFDPSGRPQSFIMRELARAFDIELAPDDFVSLPEDADLLLIVHPWGLNPWQTYQIDQFLLRKGRAIIAVDPAARAVIADPRPTASFQSTLPGVLDSLGVSMTTGVTVDASLGLPVETDVGGGRRVLEAQPLFIGAPAANLDRTDVITSELTRPVNFGLAGSFETVPREGLAYTPLVFTSAAAARAPVELALSNPRPADVVRGSTATMKPEVLALRVSGRWRTAFPGAIPDPVLPEDPIFARMASQELQALPPRVTESQGAGEVVLLADADVFDDGFFVNPSDGSPLADNAALILNAVDNLWGDDALVSLRSRTPALRPMALVDRMRETARRRLYSEQEALEVELQSTEARVAELNAQRAALGGGAEAEDEAVRTELKRFQEEVVSIRGRLREVERSFRRDIDALEARLELVNVWLPPALVLIIGLFVYIRRQSAGARP